MDSVMPLFVIVDDIVEIMDSVMPLFVIVDDIVENISLGVALRSYSKKYISHIHIFSKT